MNLVPRDSMPLHRRAEEKVLLEKAAIVFSRLSNPVRLGVLLRLIKREWSVNELALDLEISAICALSTSGQASAGRDCPFTKECADRVLSLR